jgi:hypothetical protein
MRCKSNDGDGVGLDPPFQAASSRDAMGRLVLGHIDIGLRSIRTSLAGGYSFVKPGDSFSKATRRSPWNVAALQTAYTKLSVSSLFVSG